MVSEAVDVLVSQGFGGVVGMKNRLLLCPECGAKLTSDKNALTTNEGNIYRERVCSCCEAVYFTRQEPERVTHVKMAS